jgi:CHAT domain-containing protein/tetratricopeptide (TPR) repeat protein
VQDYWSVEMSGNGRRSCAWLTALAVLGLVCAQPGGAAWAQGAGSKSKAQAPPPIEQVEGQLARAQLAEATNLVQLGALRTRSGEYEQAVDVYSRALTIVRELGDRSREANILNSIGDAYSNSAMEQRHQKALDNYLQALKIVQDLGGGKGEGYLLGKIGGEYYELNDKPKALENWGLALPIEDEYGDTKNEVTTLRNVAVAYSSEGKNEQALDFYQKALTLARAVKDGPGEALALDDLGESYAELGQREKARECFMEALAIQRQTHDPGEAVSLSGLGASYAVRDDPAYDVDRALLYYDQALAFARRAQEAGNEGKVLNDIGDVYEDLGEKHMALDYYNLALLMRRKAGDRSGEATTLSNLGDLYGELEEYEKALEALNQALPIQHETGDADGEATTLDDMGVAYDALGQDQKALEAYQRALPIRAQRGDLKGEGRTLSNIGERYLRLAQAEKALEPLNEALPIQEKLNAKGEKLDARGSAATLDDLGLANQSLGQKEGALNYFNRELAVQQALADRKGEARALSNIGEVYIGLGEPVKALDYLEKALAIRREVGDDRKGEAKTLSNLGEVYFGLEQKETALKYFNEALDIRRELGDDRKGEAESLNSIGTVYYYLGNKERQLEFYKLALGIERETKDRSGEATTLNNIGTVYSYLGDEKSALEYYKLALPIRKEVNDPRGEAYTLWCIGQSGLSDATEALRRELAALTLAKQEQDPDLQGGIATSLMGYFSQQRRPEAAILFGMDAINSYQQIRRNMSGLDKELQASFAKSKSATYRQLAELLVQSNRLGEAEHVLDLLKEEELQEVVRGGGGEPGEKVASVPLTPTQQNAERELTVPEHTAVTVEDLSLEYTALQLKGAGLSSEEHARLEVVDAQVRSGKHELDTFFAAFFTEKRETESIKTANVLVSDEKYQENQFQDTLRKLGPGVLGIRLLVSEHVYAIVVTAALRRYVELKIMPTELRLMVLKVRDELKSRSSDPKPDLMSLYRVIVGPLEAELNSLQSLSGEKGRAPTILWSLDDVLRYLPMGALYDGKQYLAERFNNVLFTPDSFQYMAISPDANGPKPRGLAMGLTKSYGGLAALPGVLPELEAVVLDPEIKESHGPMDGRLLPDEKFTLNALKTQLGPGSSYSVVHIASHFVIEGGEGKESYLMLGGESAGDAAGYRLTLGKLNESNIDFQGTRLLTLSACSTAQSYTAEDGREMDSMEMVAQQNHAQAVLASLWDVDDASTSKLMSDFYARWVGLPAAGKAEALRQAQLAFLHGGGAAATETRGFKTVSQAGPGVAAAAATVAAKATPDLSHPYYWAPFVLYGNYQ